MSRRRVLLNWILRWTERPVMARLKSPQAQRRNLAFKAGISFYAPAGTRRSACRHGGVPGLAVETRASRADRVIVYLHGGAFAIGSPRTHAALAAAICTRTKARAILPDYRLAPEHPFPAAPDDCLAVYRALLDQHDPASLVIGGDSAGGGLVFTLLADILREGLPPPAAAFAFSPVVDLSYSAPSVRANAARDVVLPAERTGDVQQTYLAGQDPADPRASPIHADFTGAPPVAIWVGDTEILHDDACNMASRLQAQGVEAHLRVEQDLPHVWPLFHNLLPEARATLDELADWLSPRWPR